MLHNLKIILRTIFVNFKNIHMVHMIWIEVQPYVIDPDKNLRWPKFAVITVFNRTWVSLTTKLSQDCWILSTITWYDSSINSSINGYTFADRLVFARWLFTYKTVYFHFSRTVYFRRPYIFSQKTVYFELENHIFSAWTR